MEKLPRNTTDEERDALKAATRHSLKIVSGKRFSLVTRVGAPTLSEYGSIAQPKDFMPVDILLDMQREMPAGVPSPLLDELAALAGFRLVPLEEDDDGGALDLDDVGTMMKEGGEAKAAALKAAAAPTCLRTVRAARKEIGESIAVKTVAARKLAAQERGLLARAGR